MTDKLDSRPPTPSTDVQETGQNKPNNNFRNADSSDTVTQFINEFRLKDDLKSSILECTSNLDKEPDSWSLKGLQAKAFLINQVSQEEFLFSTQELISQKELTVESLFDLCVQLQFDYKLYIKDLTSLENLIKLDKKQAITLNKSGTKNTKERSESMDGDDDIKSGVKLGHDFEIVCTPDELLKTLVKYRKSEDLAVSEIARRMHKDRPNIVRLEKGSSEPRMSTLQEYAKAIGVKLEIRIHND